MLSVLILFAVPTLPASLMLPWQCMDSQATIHITPRTSHRATPITMLRNVDACEAVIFTLDAALDSASGTLRPGAARLIAEARDEGTLTALLEPADRRLDDASPLRELLPKPWALQSSQPTVAELSLLRNELNVENPDGFGGSDGFGQAPGLAYGREPIAARCCVLVTTLQETIAALGSGMRAVALPCIEGDWVDGGSPSH